jgi:hypothetical protein
VSNGKSGELSTGAAVAIIAVVVIIIGVIGWAMFFRKPAPPPYKPINNIAAPGPMAPPAPPR